LPSLLLIEACGLNFGSLDKEYDGASANTIKIALEDPSRSRRPLTRVKNNDRYEGENTRQNILISVNSPGCVPTSLSRINLNEVKMMSLAAT
jgi:hypothetical protein